MYMVLLLFHTAGRSYCLARFIATVVTLIYFGALEITTVSTSHPKGAQAWVQGMKAVPGTYIGCRVRC